MEQRTLGFIGLGVMGEPMCRNLRTRSGARVLAHDLAPEPLQRLESEGVEAASSAGAVAHDCDVIFLSLPSGKELSALVRGDD